MKGHKSRGKKCEFFRNRKTGEEHFFFFFGTATFFGL